MTTAPVPAEHSPAPLPADWPTIADVYYQADAPRSMVTFADDPADDHISMLVANCEVYKLPKDGLDDERIAWTRTIADAVVERIGLFAIRPCPEQETE